MDDFEYSEIIKSLKIKIENIDKIIKPTSLRKRLEEIIKQEQKDGFWDNIEEATKLQKEKNKVETIYNKFIITKQEFQDSVDMYEIATLEEDTEILEDLFGEVNALQDKVSKLEISTMLSDENDGLNAIVSIHPGAGGTESCDWANMLYRMYLRWAEIEGFSVEQLDYQEAEEAGIKDVSFIIKGENAYGYMKVENGIHRLVRISPFDSNAKRHTSFASVMVSPEVDDNIDIEIKDKDVRIDTYRASGAGGQHVNKTDSAIRLTHIPTGVVVQCQNGRSQHKNKDTAFKMLKSRLYELELEKQAAEKKGITKDEIGWGHQIRSYVMQPYQQVKDTRSNEAYSQVNDILDGKITKVMADVLIAIQSEV